MKTFILGAADPEMSAIESLLQSAGATIFYAAGADGQRVTPSLAYQSQWVLNPAAEQVEILPEGAIFVECDFPGVTSAERCDHHRAAERPLHFGSCDCGAHFQGYGTANACLQCGKVWRDADYGFGKPPAEFWQASSIGQVAGMLGIPATPEMLLVAAADHCLAAAYAGQCPGVDPAAMAEYRIQELCSASRASNRCEARTPDEVRDSVERAKAAIADAPSIAIGWQAVSCAGVGPVFSTEAECARDAAYNLTGGGTLGADVNAIEVADLRGDIIPDLPEAAMALGVAYLAGGVSLREGDAPKIVIGGCGEGSVPGTLPVEAFLAAARNGNVAGTPVHVDGELKPYGDPVRGFAGAYVNAYLLGCRIPRPLGAVRHAVAS